MSSPPILAPELAALLKKMQRPSEAPTECGQLRILVQHYVAIEFFLKNKRTYRIAARADYLTDPPSEFTRVWSDFSLDTTDPTMLRALVVSCVLVLGRNPGPAGLQCGWRRIPPVGRHQVYNGWQLDTVEGPVLFVEDLHGSPGRESRILLPPVAREQNFVKALVETALYLVYNYQPTNQPQVRS